MLSLIGWEELRDDNWNELNWSINSRFNILKCLTFGNDKKILPVSQN